MNHFHEAFVRAVVTEQGKIAEYLARGEIAPVDLAERNRQILALARETRTEMALA